MLKRYIGGKIRYVILGASFLFIGSYFFQHAADFRVILNLSVGDSLLLACLILINHFVSGQKLYIVFKELASTPVSSWGWFKIYSISRFVGFHVSQGSNIYRMLALKKLYRFSYTDGLSLITFCSWFDLVFSLLVALFAIAFLYLARSADVAREGSLLFVCFVTIGLLPFVFPRLLRIIPAREGGWQWASAKLEALNHNILSCIRKRVLIGRMSSYSLFSIILFVLTVWFAFFSLHLNVALSAAIFLTIAMIVVGIFSLTPGNVGIAEIAFGYLSQFYGFTFGQGMIVFGLIRVVGYLLTAVLSFIFRKDVDFSGISCREEKGLNESI